MGRCSTLHGTCPRALLLCTAWIDDRMSMIRHKSGLPLLGPPTYLGIPPHRLVALDGVFPQMQSLIHLECTRTAAHLGHLASQLFLRAGRLEEENNCT